ncbi:hypothetical protein ACJ73_09149 [Blastomyces percursus]|uniref:Integrase zinc-binding domain-containing protein n=1 Tax=Blastomyces percursus TaxID=1658174 RepID=A0A1J9QD77_9EURO|nr:hypothetical protein ACJ73_09149 [Blastomyces percursus]
MASRIRSVLDPEITTTESQDFQHWSQMMFTLKLINNQPLVCREGKPIATREELFRILTIAHQQCQHGAQRRTGAQARMAYSLISQELVKQYIKICPTCSPALSEPLEPALKGFPDVMEFDKRMARYLYQIDSGRGSNPFQHKSLAIKLNMSRTLTLLCFEQSRLFPQDTAHWALYLWDAHAETGTLFHARKDSLASGQTLYEPIADVSPMASRSLRSSVEVASGLALSDEALDVQCRAARKIAPSILFPTTARSSAARSCNASLTTGQLLRANSMRWL